MPAPKLRVKVICFIDYSVVPLLGGGVKICYRTEVMYAIIESGGKQYRVAEGDVIRCDLVASEAGSEVTFDKVVLAGDGDAVQVGTPTLDGATVSGTVLRQAKDKRKQTLPDQHGQPAHAGSATRPGLGEKLDVSAFIVHRNRPRLYKAAATAKVTKKPDAGFPGTLFIGPGTRPAVPGKTNFPPVAQPPPAVSFRFPSRGRLGYVRRARARQAESTPAPSTSCHNDRTCPGPAAGPRRNWRT